MQVTGDDLRDAARALNLSGRALARELGINERTYRRYLDGSLPIPRTVELAVMGLRSERDGR
jgi:transcriptional regulator with XRE-family HTH domain